MKSLITGLFFFGFVTNISVAQLTKLNDGNWAGRLQLDKDVYLPFDIIIDKNIFTIKNAEELITLSLKNTTKDSIDLVFPNFDSFLRVQINNKKKITGYWYNRLKGQAYKIPFIAELKKEKKTKTTQNLTGNWEATFSTETKNPYPALGVFEQVKSKLTGTFLTETGDYRYLSGVVENNKLIMSTFDGSHAFLFTADIKDTLSGFFYSGSHWKTNWTAFKNPEFKLRDADSITYLNHQTNKLFFSFPNLDGELFDFPNAQFTGKVVIVQLMGSWCPNCLDEAVFYKELLATYQSRGLEIITVCYEIPKTFEQKIEYVKRMANRNSLGFHFLIGGDAQKNLASSHFPMLNQVVSFPTSLFLNKAGEVVRIHTGFSGPGTGSYFEEYKEKTLALIEALLSE